MSVRIGGFRGGLGQVLGALLAAIYVRKSTDQAGVSDEQRSVTRQIEHARQYAARQGWLVREDCIYVDDGISGAEFVKRPGFLRLMNALKPRPPFQVLIMSEESRLGREAIETSYALKQILDAGVRVFYYLEDRERTLDSATDKVLLAVTSYASELERERAQQRTHDALLRKARAGHVTGARAYGYAYGRRASATAAATTSASSWVATVSRTAVSRTACGRWRLLRHTAGPRFQL